MHSQAPGRVRHQLEADQVRILTTIERVQAGEWMSAQRGYASPNELVLKHSLEKLRARSGLTADRLTHDTAGIAAPLMSLAAVRRHATVHQGEPAHPAPALVGACLRA